jgi:NTE family protein
MSDFRSTSGPATGAATGSHAGATSISLVLGSGGARGLAHIGIIQWLDAHGFRIQSIAGSSMGALVGGIYAAGELPAYRDWVCALQRTDVLRFLDIAWRSSGLLKGDRIMDTLRELVGEHLIEDLPVDFTAVATDIDRQREVWLARGPLFDAIRASIAVPTVFTPHRYLGLRLVDGGLLNPVPITPTFRDLTELTIAVNLNGTAAGMPWPRQAPPKLPEPAPAEAPPVADGVQGNDLRGRIRTFLDEVGRSFKSTGDGDDDLDMFELMSRSLETMQNAVAAVKLAAYAPDVIINIPRDACQAHEFHRAQEMIELGEQLAGRALGSFGRRMAEGADGG